MPKTPFDLVYKELVQQLREDDAIQERVAKKSLIEFNNRTDPRREAVQTADLPELICYLRAIRGNLHASSSTLHLTTVWEMIISSGEFNVEVNNSLAFSVLRVGLNWKQNLALLEWRDRVFVKDVRLANSESGESIRERNRNIAGWATLMDMEIDMSFLRSDFLLGL